MVAATTSSLSAASPASGRRPSTTPAGSSDSPLSEIVSTERALRSIHESAPGSAHVNRTLVREPKTSDPWSRSSSTAYDVTVISEDRSRASARVRLRIGASLPDRRARRRRGGPLVVVDPARSAVERTAGHALETRDALVHRRVRREEPGDVLRPEGARDHHVARVDDVLGGCERCAGDAGLELAQGRGESERVTGP